MTSNRGLIYKLPGEGVNTVALGRRRWWGVRLRLSANRVRTLRPRRNFSRFTGNDGLRRRPLCVGQTGDPGKFAAAVRTAA